MKNRIVYLDYLRVFATFAVIILHAAASNWYVLDVNSFEWKTLHIYRSMVRWGVPVFVMISGSLFLGKAYDIKKIYQKNILHLFTAFFFWSAIYVLIEGGDILDFFTGHYHMWFIPMIGWLYICIPILHKIAESEEIMKYFLVLAFLFSCLFPQVVQVVNDFGQETLIELVDVFDNIFVLANFHYAAYFVGGYYLNKLDFNKRSRGLVYILGIMGVLGTIWVDTFLSLKTGVPVETYGGNFSLFVLLQSIAIFVWMKYHVPVTEKMGTIVHKLAKYSFGAYLIHALVIEQLALRFGLNTLSFHPIVSVPVIGIIVCIISFSISAIVHRIPFLNKYIV